MVQGSPMPWNRVNVRNWLGNQWHNLKKCSQPTAETTSFLIKSLRDPMNSCFFLLVYILSFSNDFSLFYKTLNRQQMFNENYYSFDFNPLRGLGVGFRGGWEVQIIIEQLVGFAEEPEELITKTACLSHN